MKDKKTKIIIAVIAIGLLYLFGPYKLAYIGVGDKVMAHRVNSLEKLTYTSMFYSGVELDLVYHAENQSFDINHPPAKSINLNLDQYFAKIDNKNLKIWLDLKNLNLANASLAANTLDKLVKKHGLNKSLILVESPEVELLPIFAALHFKTSFYLPHQLHAKSENSLNKTIDSIKILLAKHPTTGVSSDVKNYEILQKHLNKTPKYLWDLHSSLSKKHIQNHKNFRRYAKDSSVKIILVKVDLPIGNR